MRTMRDETFEAERHTRESLEVALDRAIGDGDVDAIVELRRAQRILDGGLGYVRTRQEAEWEDVGRAATTAFACMRYPHIFRLLMAAGHSDQKAAEIVIEAQRRDRVAQNSDQTAVYQPEEAMTANVPGDREKALRAQREGDLDGIPDFLNRTKGLSQAEIDALAAKARRSAARHTPSKAVAAAAMTAPKANLTDHDKAVIASLKKEARDRDRAAAKERLAAMKRGRQAAAAIRLAAKQAKASDVPVAATQEDAVASAKKKTAKKTKTKTAKPKAAPKSAVDKAFVVRPGSKLKSVVALLTREEGCTTKDILASTGWPSVSVPAMAKAAGLTLKKEKEDGITRYHAA